MASGTPPRVHADAIDYTLCEEQPGEEPPVPFSFLSRSIEREQIPCHLARTTPETHRIVQQALAEAPLFTGQIRGTGPRYCPSIELKVARFPERTSHQLYLEPEGRDSREVYLNGISTSLPHAVQEAMVRSIPALRNARIMRWGYAVEYDYVPPRCLRPTLEVRDVPGLYHAGQLNGTSGYEEAAAQGLLAGANAANAALGRAPFLLDRSQAYIGVLVDDLITKSVDDPYRLFTSRAEHRLVLRADNADLRLTPLAAKAGLLPPERAEAVEALREEIAALRACLRETRRDGVTLEKHLRRPEVTVEALARREPDGSLARASDRAREQLSVEIKYEGYIRRQEGEIERYRRVKRQRIPEGFDFTAVRGLRGEALEKLEAFRPADLEDAGRIAGVSPADVALLAVHLKRQRAAAGALAPSA